MMLLSNQQLMNQHALTESDNSSVNV